VNPHLPIAWPQWPPGIRAKVAAALQKLVRRSLRWYINPIVEQQNLFNAAVLRALEGMADRQEIQAGETAALGTELRASLESQKLEVPEVVRLRLQRLEQALKSLPSSPAEAPGAAVPSPAQTTSIDYYYLGAKFRGPGDLKERQSAYVEYFRGCHNMVDLGCGRGEFVELLLENGIGARGIDMDPDVVAFAQDRGLPVELAEAGEFLQRLPDRSLDGVFLSQVVEHMPAQHILQLFELCYRKLVPGAVLIAETINPASLFALANWFMIDPSHVKPVHPETMRFLLEGAGFWKIQLRFATPVASEDRLELLPAEGVAGTQDREQLERLNRNFRRLNHVVFGDQDYAAIAERPPDPLPDGSNGR
jgi:O-antigen chain-terminating methyltransferase